MAATDITPRGNCWQRTVPSSAMMRMADPGAQVPVMRACRDAIASAFRTISWECVSSALPTSSGIRSIGTRPLAICAARRALFPRFRGLPSNTSTVGVLWCGMDHLRFACGQSSSTSPVVSCT